MLNRALNILGFSRCVPEKTLFILSNNTNLSYNLFLICYICIDSPFSFDQLLSRYDIDLLYSYIVYYIRKLFFIYNIHF